MIIDWALVLRRMETVGGKKERENVVCGMN